MLSKYQFGFNNKKSYFWASTLGFVDNFKKYFEDCVLNTQKLSFEYAMLYGKKRKPQNAGNQQNQLRKLLKSYQFGIYVPFSLQEQGKLLLSFITMLTLIILINTFESWAINTQNDEKSAVNNSVNSLKN